eukprot:CAMPEP_0169131746 /NCGR_PEP_ID=MMETSP1015-20121227/38417_1 /TAXON_ID=342587 /ORGANISM="Karlodinium micrum, Strain CCMP2283" /LENGTH=313 /DNA_ID=CAMNT_0009196039 /DNA_START=53 /DNA_END=994 /DNA_ORIENTATION=-
MNFILCALVCLVVTCSARRGVREWEPKGEIIERKGKALQRLLLAVNPMSATLWNGVHRAGYAHMRSLDDQIESPLARRAMNRRSLLGKTAAAAFYGIAAAAPIQSVQAVVAAAVGQDERKALSDARKAVAQAKDTASKSKAKAAVKVAEANLRNAQQVAKAAQQKEARKNTALQVNVNKAKQEVQKAKGDALKKYNKVQEAEKKLTAAKSAATRSATVLPVKEKAVASSRAKVAQLTQDKAKPSVLKAANAELQRANKDLQKAQIAKGKADTAVLGATGKAKAAAAVLANSEGNVQKAMANQESIETELKTIR